MAEKWPIEKIMTCLKRIVHPEVLPQISQEETSKIVKEYSKVIDFLKFIYEKSNNKIEIYGTVEDMIKSIRKIDKIPEYIQFSSREHEKNQEISMICALSTPDIEYFYIEWLRKNRYSSKKNMTIGIFKKIFLLVKSWDLNQVASRFFVSWMTANLNKVLRGFKGYYQIVSIDLQNTLVQELEQFFKKKPKIKISKEEPIIMQQFSNLRVYFDKEDEEYFNNALIASKEELRISTQEYLQKAYSHIIYLIKNLERIFEPHSGLFTPSQNPPISSQKPLLRLLSCGFSRFHLVREVKNAIEMMTGKDVPEDLLILESEEERNLGIVHAIDPQSLAVKIEELQINYRNFAIIEDQFTEDSRDIALPIISSFGTHCIPAIDAFESILYYLAVILKVFQKSNNENLDKVFNWVEELLDTLFIEKPFLYLIELWKINEVIDRAREELSIYLTEEGYEVPFQSIYQRGHIRHHFANLTMNLLERNEKNVFFSGINEIICDRIPEPYSIRDVYNAYFNFIEEYLDNFHPKINSFTDNQSRNKHFKILKKKENPNPEEQELLIYNEESLEKQESEPETEIRACCSAESRLQELENEMEKLKLENDHLKIDNQQKSQLEDDLRLQIHMHSVSFRAKYQKKEEELERSQNAETQLEEMLKIQEQNHLEEIKDLKKDSFKIDIEMVLLKDKLRKETAENMDLKSKIEVLEKESKEFMQKNEFLMSENGVLRAENFKNTEFQLKIKEHSETLENVHCGLVDSARSTLHRLCSRYPESDDVQEAKNDVMKLEDCLDEYMENVEKEYEKLQE